MSSSLLKSRAGYNIIKCMVQHFHMNLRLVNSPQRVRTLQPILGNNYNLFLYRQKSKGKKQQIESESESDDEDNKNEEWNEEIVDKTTKTFNTNVISLRADVILKAGLGMARNKVEEFFYESKIRVNGKKILKKSETVQEGDEIDVIKGVNVNNPKFLTVARVEVLSVVLKKEHYSVKLRRCKSLTVDNYEQPWKQE